MNALPVLIRREFWEHRVLWLAPLAVAALYILVCLFPTTGFNMGGIDLQEAARTGSPDRPVVVFTAVQMVLNMLLYMLMSVVVFFYLGDCLYAERKDRSILFWKSLPISDGATVLSKFLVAILVLPLGVYLLALVTNVLAFGILIARFHDNPLLQLFVRWDTEQWLRLNGLLLADLAVFALWYAPVVAYQLLVSAWAKSSVLVWTVLPPLMVSVAERLLFGTWNVAHVIGLRLGLVFADLDRGQGFGINHHDGGGAERLLDGINALPLLTRADLWIGVVVAAALLFATVRIRRYRDDS